MNEIMYDENMNYLIIDVAKYGVPKSGFTFQNKSRNCANMLESSTVSKLGASHQCYNYG